MSVTRSPEAAATAAPEGAIQLALSGALTIDDVRLLAQAMHDFDLVELEIARPGGDQVRLRRGEGPAPAPPAAAAPPPALPQPEARAVKPDDLRHVTSPFVGTFYRAAGPDAPNFVEPGQ